MSTPPNPELPSRQRTLRDEYAPTPRQSGFDGPNDFDNDRRFSRESTESNPDLAHSKWHRAETLAKLTEGRPDPRGAQGVGDPSYQPHEESPGIDHGRSGGPRRDKDLPRLPDEQGAAETVRSDAGRSKFTENISWPSYEPIPPRSDRRFDVGPMQPSWMGPSVAAASSTPRAQPTMKSPVRMEWVTKGLRAVRSVSGSLLKGLREAPLPLALAAVAGAAIGAVGGPAGMAGGAAIGLVVGEGARRLAAAYLKRSTSQGGEVPAEQAAGVPSARAEANTATAGLPGPERVSTSQSAPRIATQDFGPSFSASVQRAMPGPMSEVSAAAALRSEVVALDSAPDGAARRPTPSFAPPSHTANSSTTRRR
ncbi:hypothetical protein QFZ63_000146 [Streptomyces sp. B3I7]|nr:hypothetical protein [Streptomyces sp. B3I7]